MKPQMPFPFTGFCYAIGQGAYLKPEYLKAAIRLAADCGYTHFLAYLENMIRLPSIEKACPASAYTLEQWREFDAVAVAAGIELVPSLTTIGHSRKICQVYPELAGGEGLEIDPTTTAAREWVVRCLREFCAVSSARYFLINGDEWQTPNHLLARPDLDPGELWVGQINLAAACLTEMKRVPIVWHDMLMHYPQALARLSRQVVIAFWFYDEDSDYAVMRMFKDMGFRVLMASGLASDASLTRRRVRGTRTALAAVRKHGADGFFMTSWADCRWEKQQLNIPMVARLIRGEPVPDAILDAISWNDVRRRLPETHPFQQTLVADCRQALTDPAWNPYPEYRDWLRALLANDVAAANAISAPYLAADSPLLVPPVAGPALYPGSAAASAVTTAGFGLQVSQTETAGDVLRVTHGNESFLIYPKFGAVLEAWQVGGAWVIPPSVPNGLKRLQYLPGGYRSYSVFGGFRPIWALGTQHSPCILWNQPWQWRRLESDADTLGVELYRSSPHADLRYQVRVRRGTPGFEFTATAVNKLPVAYAAFNWNLVLPLAGDDFDRVRFAWTENGRERHTSLPELRESFFRLPATAGLTVSRPEWTLTLSADPEQTTGFFTDWAATYGFLTPDLRGVYRRLGPGDIRTVRWHLSAARHNRS